MDIDDKTLEGRLDKLLSTIVRVEEPSCYGCGKFVRYSRRQASHYVPRIVKKTRWDRNNVHTCCSGCNVELDGNLKEYRKTLVKEIGEEEVLRLEEYYDRYKNGKLKAPTRAEKEKLYDEYLKKVRYLEKLNYNRRCIPEDW